MRKYNCYNTEEYIKRIIRGVHKVQIEAIFPYVTKCKSYDLSNEVSDYIQYVNEKPFYISPNFEDVCVARGISTLNAKFMLFSAPGATGKTTLAKHIAYSHNALYWDLSKNRIGDNFFSGSILKAFGASNFSDFVSNLCSGNAMLIVDAFDEAEMTSGRSMLSNFLLDINNEIKDTDTCSVILLARTETAQFIASLCLDNNIPIKHYEIGFFSIESSAKEFVKKKIELITKAPITKSQIDCMNKYFSKIQEVVKDGVDSFLGYAPVLEAIATHIASSSNTQKLINDLAEKKTCTEIIISIMTRLTEREQDEKVIQALNTTALNKQIIIDNKNKIYDKDEQIARLLYYIVFKDSNIDNYPIAKFLPNQLMDDYQLLLNTFVPQHPFIRHTNTETNFAGPAFRDYSLSEIMSQSIDEGATELYLDNACNHSFFPSQLYFDCYIGIKKEQINLCDVSYLFESFKAKAKIHESAYLSITEEKGDVGCDDKLIASFLLINNKGEIIFDDSYECVYDSKEIIFNQLINTTIVAPSFTLIIGGSNVVSKVESCSFECKKIIWRSDRISITVSENKECFIESKEAFEGMPSIFEDAVHGKLHIFAPNIKNYYKLIPYKYENTEDAEIDNITYARCLRSILIEFRTHSKDTLAKHAERIDYIIVGDNIQKRKIYNYLCQTGIMFKAGHLYKINEDIMKSKHINFISIKQMDLEQLNKSYLDFCDWLSKHP